MKATGRKAKRRSWGDPNQAASWIELIEQWREVELVGSPSVHQHERALRLAVGRSKLVLEQIDVAHGLGQARVSPLDAG